MNPSWRKLLNHKFVIPIAPGKKNATPVSVQSVETDSKSEQRGHLGLGQWVRNLPDTIKDVTVWQISSAERWSPENVLSLYLAGDHWSPF